MDGQVITTKSDLERILLDQSMVAKPLSLSLLELITNNFSHEIGRGGFAVVYKGHLKYREVAVKQLVENSIDEEKFIGEVNCLMKAKHKNIVQFLGYCSNTLGGRVEHKGKFVMADVRRQRLLCFEYVPNGSLDEYIKDASREWGNCYKIIKGVCEGLHHLHKERIVHRDLKPANILLHNDMVPKITDFGISRCFDELQTHHFTSKLIGTLGYIAPEIVHHRKITFKSDIYNLGTIITEILTGGDQGHPKFEEVQEHWSHKLKGSQKEVQLEQIRVCTEVAQSCLVYNPEDRPSVQKIIDILKKTEREERCIEPSSSSHNPRSSLVVLGRDCCKSDAAAAAATPLGSTVAASNMSKRKGQQPQPPCENGIGLQPFSHGPTLDTESMATAIEMLMQAISKVYTGEKIYWSVQDIRCLYNIASHKKGEELYSAAENTMASEVQRLCRPLHDAARENSSCFLEELQTKWDLHSDAVGFIDRTFNIIDPNFGRNNGKTPMYELGLRLWHDEMTRSDKIWPRLTRKMKPRKGGEDKLVPGVDEMFAELGADIMDGMPILSDFVKDVYGNDIMDGMPILTHFEEDVYGDYIME